MIDLAKLKSDILTGTNSTTLAPLAGAPGPLGNYPDSQDGTIADFLNAKTISFIGSLEVGDVHKLLYGNGDYLTLKSAQMAGNTDAVVAFAMLDDAVKFGKGRVDIAATATKNQLAKLVTDNLITQASVDALNSLATSMISIAQRDYEQDVHNLDVARCFGRTGV